MKELGEVIPRIGIGEIHLGQSKDSIQELLGVPPRENKKRRNRIQCCYDGFNLTFSEDELLESIEAYPEVNVTYKGLNVFTDNSAWGKLIDDDSTPFQLSGTIILLDLGVSMWKDPDEESQNKSFVLSADGVWDFLKDRFKAYVPKTV